MVAESAAPPTPSPFNYILSFLLVGLCWGFTTPFIRRAAVSYTPPTHPSIHDPSRSWLARQLAKVFWTVVGLVRKPAYAIPLVVNLTGSIWFFLLVGQAGKWFHRYVFDDGDSMLNDKRSPFWTGESSSILPRQCKVESRSVGR